MNHIQWDSQQPGVAACCLLHAKSVTFPKPEALIYVQSYGQVVFLINTNALLNGVVPHSRENKMSYFYIRGFLDVIHDMLFYLEQCHTLSYLCATCSPDVNNLFSDEFR
jgi:hypothetical protein